MEDKVEFFVEKLKEINDFDRVNFVILFGSRSKGKASKLSDYDFAIHYEGDREHRFNFRKRILGEVGEEFDVQIFQDLPLHVRIQVLRGKIIYSKDEGFVYEVFYKTIKEFDRFKKYYYDYIDRRSKIK